MRDIGDIMRKIFLISSILLFCVSILFAQNLPGLNAGNKAPDFEALNYKGEKIRLSQFYKKGPVVLIFYRGGWCPYCNLQLKQLQSKLDDFKQYNASVIAVSVDKIQSTAKTVEDNDLGFEVISNPEGDILGAYNLVYKVSDELNKKYKEQHNIDLEAASGRTDHVIAIPATFIIDQSGNIVFAYANKDYKVRTSSEEILQELEKLDKSQEKITFTPVEHATFTIQTDQVSIYVDPVGDTGIFSKFAEPDIILITDIHYDHLNADVIKHLRKENTVIVGPEAVIDELGFGEVLKNGESKIFKNVQVKAIPMYNLTPDRLNFHEKGRGNGYVLTLQNKRIYISGDTEDIHEMRNLKDIDYAFVCMNLPYTMTIEQSASAVLDFKPKVVFPYHYRGKEGVSDIEGFKELVSKNNEIEVRFLDWY